MGRFNGVAAAHLIDQKTRNIRDIDRHPPHARAKAGEEFRHPRRRTHACDHLDQFHHRHGIEEMQPRDPFGIGALCGNRGDRQRRGVSGQYSLRPDCSLQCRENLTLDTNILDHRFDHNAAGCKTTDIREDLDAGNCRLRLLGAHPPLVRSPCQQPVDLRQRFEGRFAVGVIKLNCTAAHCRDLGDAAPHGAGTNNADNQALLIGIQTHRNSSSYSNAGWR